MAPESRSNPPLQPSAAGSSTPQGEPSREATHKLTLREAAREAGCSDSTLRRLVKSGEVPFSQEETSTGFRYMFEASTISVIAHKAAMRRPSGRPSSRRPEGVALHASNVEAIQEASRQAAELAELRVERDLLRAENSRLWAQIERLTESVTQLALPASRTSVSDDNEKAEVRERVTGFWSRATDWFWGRDRKQ